MAFKFIHQHNLVSRSGLLICVISIGVLCIFAGCTSRATLVGNSSFTETPAPTPNLPGDPFQQEEIPASMRFTKIDTDDGLTQSTTNVILQDSLGFMWFGTEDGLNRYDGYNFEVFLPRSDDEDSINDRWITSLLSAGDGDLWVGTRQGGLNYYDAESGHFDHYMHDDVPSSLIGNHVNVLYRDHLDRVWIGTTTGLDRFIAESGEFEHYFLNYPEGLNITAVHEDDESNLWIGTQVDGLFKLVPGVGITTHYLNDETDQNSLLSDSIRGIQPANEGSIWVGTASGLDLFSPDMGTFIHFTHDSENLYSLLDNRVRTMVVDHYGNLWLGTASGLDCYDDNTNRFFHYGHDALDPMSLSNNAVLSIYESQDEVLWISAYGGFINKYYRGMDRFTYYHHSNLQTTTIAGNMVVDISVDSKGFVWLGTLDGGVSRLNSKTGRFNNYYNDPDEVKSLAGDEVWSVFKDSSSTLWVGTNTGLKKIESRDKYFTLYPISDSLSNDTVSGMVYDIVEDTEGDLWFGTSGGLDQYMRDEEVVIHYVHDPKVTGGISDSAVTRVYIDPSGILWLGTTSGGLNRFDPQQNLFISYQNDPEDKGSISNNSVLSILHDQKGRIWVGTDGGGLDLHDPLTGSFSHNTEEDGLSSNVVYGILEDRNGKLWLSTNNGISSYDPENGIFRNYYESDGLQGNEFNMNAYAQDDQGILYFGGINGLTSFNPELISASEYLPPVVLLSVTQNGRLISPETNLDRLEKITLKWPLNSFEFEFASLSYVDPKKNHHAYKLENFDQDWIDAGSSREGRYTNLPGGTYMLRIKGSNNDGVWNESTHTLMVEVIPAFWQTVWFQVSAVFLFFGSIITISRVRSASIQANTRELERQVKERTQEIERLFEKTKELAVVEERNRLARELHDSAKQKAFAALAQLGTAGGVLPKDPRSARFHLKEAEDLVYEVIEELTFLIQEMYPLALKEKGLVTSLREYVFDWEARTDIQVRVSIENEKRLSLDVEQAIYRAVQEALSNIARHSKASSVKINLDFSDHEVNALISDNGCGFDPRTRQSGMGLRTIQERMERLGGTMKIDSNPNRGTSLMLTVPVQMRPSDKGEDNG